MQQLTYYMAGKCTVREGTKTNPQGGGEGRVNKSYRPVMTGAVRVEPLATVDGCTLAVDGCTLDLGFVGKLQVSMKTTTKQKKLFERIALLKLTK